MSNKQTFFYRVKISRDGQPATREGTVQAKYPLDALDAIVEMAVNEWKRPLQKIELYQVDENGEMVASTTMGDRIDRVLETHKRVKPNGTIAQIAQRRAERRAEEAKQEHQSKVKVTVKTSHDVKVTEWNWTAQVGSHYRPETFSTPKQSEDGRWLM